ncbi:MAG: ATP-binding protein [Thermosphaera sp.]
MIPTETPLDALTGGLAPGAIALIYGPTGCGKTTLCLKIVNNLIQRGYTAIYIDTESNVVKEMFVKPERVELVRAGSLAEQSEAIKKLPEMASGKLKAIIIVDTMTGHFHRQVLAAPPQYRAVRAVELGGKLIAQLATIRQALKGESAAIVTAHLRSPVGDAFKESEARKVATLIRRGARRPSIRDFEKFVAYDPVKWLGGQGLGMHTQMRFRIWVESESIRILQLEKWPGAQPLCVRYDPDFNVIGGKFKMDELTRARLLEAEETPLQKLVEEGIPVEEGAVEGAPQPEEGRTTKRRGKREVRVGEVPSPEELIEKERKEA